MSRGAWIACVLERMRVLIVAGVATGALVVGIGSRLAMLLLRVTSSERVNGLQSDDDFTIGRFTLAGTYNLVMLGSLVGVIGFGVYRLVKPWLIGPQWFRRLTLGIASGVVVGPMLIHADGIDFTVLKPKWLAIGLFIALPALFAVAIGVVVDAVDRPESWTARRRWRWLLPIIIVACVPVILIFLALALIPVGIWALAGDVDFPAEVRSVRWLPNAIRSAWLVIVALGLSALINDVTALV
ncbi:MAG: hypothetical protein K8R99_09975 [Actinomycetia bacterium]|nr:hypothetical protein [Actinomycetes bacterium]